MLARGRRTARERRTARPTDEGFEVDLNFKLIVDFLPFPCIVTFHREYDTVDVRCEAMDEASDDDGVFENGHGTTTTGPGEFDGREPKNRENPMLDAESNALRRAHETAGMREGYEVGKEETVQAGFDHGFRLASTAGFAWGRALGLAAMLDVACGVSKDEVKDRVCDALWEEHGELKERFPERRQRAGEEKRETFLVSLAELQTQIREKQASDAR